MSRHRKLKQFCQEIAKINTHLCLQLPATAKSLRQQIRCIHRLQAQLETLQIKIQASAKSCRSPKLQNIHQKLLALVKTMLSEAKSFQLLAEEFITDSEGAISCLQSVNQKQPLRYHEYLNILELIDLLDLEACGFEKNMIETNSAIADLTNSPDLDFTIILHWLDLDAI